MQREAESHASEDAKRREEVEIRNTADTMAYTAEKALRDNKEKISDELNKEVEEKVAAVRSTLQGTDLEAVKRASQELSDTMQKVGSAVYQQQPPPDEQPPSGDGDDEGTVEGEFHEV